MIILLELRKRVELKRETEKYEIKTKDFSRRWNKNAKNCNCRSNDIIGFFNVTDEYSDCCVR